LPFVEVGDVVVPDDPVELRAATDAMHCLQRVDRERRAGALELHRRDPQIIVIARRQLRHGETVVARSDGLIRFERLVRGGDVDDGIPSERLGGGENGLEVTAMEGIERAAADADSHTEAGAAARDSRTMRASARTSARTPSPMTAEISK